MSMFKMIREAQTLAAVKGSKRLDTLNVIKEHLGKTLHEADQLFEPLNEAINPKDYDEWLRQIVLHSQALSQSGMKVSLNKRSSFADIAGEVLENDPLNKVNFGDEELVNHVINTLWKKYQTTKEDIRVQKVVKAREDEEFTKRLVKDIEDEELNVNKPPQPEETDEFQPSQNNYNDEDMSSDVSGEMTDEPPLDDESSDVDSAECPYDQGTPEHEAWMAGYEAATSAEGDDVQSDDQTSEIDSADDVSYDADETPVDLEGGADENLDAEVEQRRPPMEDEEFYGDDGEFDDEKFDAARREFYADWQADRDSRARGAYAKNDPKHHDFHNRVADMEDEEDASSKGYRAAQAEYRSGKKGVPPAKQSKAWERGYEEFMKDTEGQRHLARVTHASTEEEEKSDKNGRLTLKDILKAPKNTISQALKSVEKEGEKIARLMNMPRNPHPAKSMAFKAWDKGFKNAVKSTMGFFDKPIPVKGKKANKKK